MAARCGCSAGRRSCRRAMAIASPTATCASNATWSSRAGLVAASGRCGSACRPRSWWSRRAPPCSWLLSSLESAYEVRRFFRYAGEPMADPIRIVAALIKDQNGRVLLVRKRGTASFMQPGGKRDAGEDDVAALTRELDEELGCGVVPRSVFSLGTFECQAANEV